MTVYIAPQGSDPEDVNAWQPLGEAIDAEVLSYGKNINHIRTKVQPLEMEVTLSPETLEILAPPPTFNAALYAESGEPYCCPVCGSPVWEGFITGENEVELRCTHETA